MNRCPGCGRPVDAEIDTDCPACGAALDATGEAPETDEDLGYDTGYDDGY